MVALDLLSVTNQQVCFYYEILQIMYKYLQLRIILFFFHLDKQSDGKSSCAKYHDRYVAVARKTVGEGQI